MKIVIAGAGAMGSRFAIMLKRRNDVTLIDGWPAHIEAIREHGYERTNGEDRSPFFDLFAKMRSQRLYKQT